MDIAPELFKSLAIVGTGLCAGAFVMGTLGMRPSTDALAVSQQIDVRKQLVHRVSKFMPGVMMFAAIASICAAVTAPPDDRVLTAIAAALASSMIVLTLSVHSPRNREFMTWSNESTLPINWRTRVDEWNRGDFIRMIIAITAFLMEVFVP